MTYDEAIDKVAEKLNQHIDREVLMIVCGNYDCMACGERYQVNDPDSWRPCSWALCHDCYAKNWHVPNPYPVVTYNVPLLYAAEGRDK